MKSTFLTRFVAVCTAVTVSAFTAVAQDNNDKKDSKADKMEVTVTEAGFMKTAAEANMAEIKLAELATEKAEAAPVKEFARMLIKDHTQAGTELKSLAEAKDVKLPKSVSEVNADKMKAIGKLSGPAFDRAFMEEMHLCHAKDIAMFTAAAETVKDPDLKGFITAKLPVLKAHDEKAMQAAHGQQ